MAAVPAAEDGLGMRITTSEIGSRSSVGVEIRPLALGEKRRAV
jgi:hypothetical protein